MSNYYKYSFVTPAPIYALIKEELSSYFSAGMVDDLLFPTWTDTCLKKLGKSSYSIQETVLNLDAFQSTLPEGFLSVREAWLCAPGDTTQYTHPSAVYEQCKSINAILVSSDEDPECPKCPDNCLPEMVRVVYKYTETDIIQYYGRKYLLKPGNIATKDKCSQYPCRIGNTSPDTFDIHGNKFTTNFRRGTVYLIYYAKQSDSKGYQLVPDNIHIQQYIEQYIKYKIFEQLSNTVVDETANQIERKKQFYYQLQLEALVAAQIENKKETVAKQQASIRRTLNRNLIYELSDGNYWNRRC